VVNSGGNFKDDKKTDGGTRILWFTAVKYLTFQFIEKG
jgi:hypothetical protein